MFANWFTAWLVWVTHCPLSQLCLPWLDKLASSDETKYIHTEFYVHVSADVLLLASRISTSCCFVSVFCYCWHCMTGSATFTSWPTSSSALRSDSRRQHFAVAFAASFIQIGSSCFLRQSCSVWSQETTSRWTSVIWSENVKYFCGMIGVSCPLKLSFEFANWDVFLLRICHWLWSPWGWEEETYWSSVTHLYYLSFQEHGKT